MAFGAGVALGSLAGLELAVREHFAGYKSHTLLLSGAVAVAVIALTAVAVPGGVKAYVVLPASAAAFGLALWLFTRAFQRRAGGDLFRVR